MRENKHIISIDNYYEDPKKNKFILFKSASTGGVNIINYDNSYNNEGYVQLLEYGQIKDKQYDLKVANLHKFSSLDICLFKKIRNNFYSFMNTEITG
jgi:hypothetical protein